MSKKVKVGILRARHNMALPYIPDQACISMIMTSASHHSMFDYWSYNTYGYLDFLNSALFPWVDISITADDVSRETQVKKAYEATKALPNSNVDDFDAYFLLTYPGRMTIPNPKAGQPGEAPTKVLNFDGGAGPEANEKPACAIPVMNADHTFMCHEMGHVLGFGHSYGVMNNGIDWDGKPPYDEGFVYGDPYDIMSSGTFGTHSLDPKKPKYYGRPTFAGPSHSQWPIEPKINMGPAPAGAHLHLWDPASVPANRIFNMPTPGGVGKQSVRLYARFANTSPSLVIIHPANEDKEGRGRCYVEFRISKGWDLGMDVYGNDLARQGVVVHTLADTADEGVRCWYRGHIPVPVEIDSDLQVTGTPLVVRVIGQDVNEGYVDIEISTVKQRGVDISVTRRNEEVTVINPQEMSTPCGDSIVYGTHILQSLYFFMPSAYGYGGEGAPDAKPPKVSWKINGVAISGTSSLNIAESVYPVNYTVDPITGELSLSSNAGDRYSLPLQVTVTESDNANPTSAASVFNPPGWFDGFSAADGAKLERCMSRYLRRVRLRRRDLLIPPGPDPYRKRLSDRINQARLQEVVRNISQSNPAEAVAIGVLSIMRYGNNIQTQPKRNFQKAAITVVAIASVFVTVAVLANAIKGKKGFKRG